MEPSYSTNCRHHLELGHNFRPKDRQKTLMKSGVVYRLTCSCGSSHIRKTRCNLVNRRK